MKMKSAAFTLAVLLGGLTGCPAQDPSHLDPVPRGQGFQFVTGEIQVPPGTEAQDCYFFKVRELAASNGMDPDQPVNLHRIQVAQRPGSHHMNIFRVRTLTGLDPANGLIQKGANGVGECFRSSNWSDWPLVANSQQDGQVDWTLPEGVANTLQPDEWLMLQTHFVNATTQKTPQSFGRVTVNIWAIEPSKVTAQLGTLFATKQSIRICQSNPRPTFHGTCQFNSPQPVTIIGANGHFHSRGERFSMSTWDGQTSSPPPASQRFYESRSWDDPPMLTSPELRRDVPAGGGVWYTCSYAWKQPEPSVGCSGLNQYDATKYGTSEAQQDCCYTFGPVVEQNEHCNAFIYYYPKQDDVNCF